MAEPFIPTLQLNLKTADTPDVIITYVLRHFFLTPASIFDNYDDLEISFTELNAKAGGDLNILKTLVIDALKTVYKRYWPNSTVNIGVDFEQVDPNTVAYYTYVQVKIEIDGEVYTGYSGKQLIELIK